MKTILKTLLGIIFLTTVVFFTSCSGPADDATPSNVINDSEGIKIDLEWSTGGTGIDALEEADLDLRIYKGGTKVLWSEKGSSFERIGFNPDLYADGVYTVTIFLYSNDEHTNYTATVNGISVSNPYTFTSTFAAEETQREIEALTITKAGSRYTIEPIEP